MPNPDVVSAPMAVVSPMGRINQLKEVLSGIDTAKSEGGAKGARPTEDGIEFITPSPKRVRIVPSGRFGLGEFATTQSGLREHLNAVRHSVANYLARKKKKRPFNIFIAAAPGSGRSFFIKELLSSLDGLGKLPYFELSANNLSSVRELDSAWRFVRTMNLNDVIPAVFIDDCDSLVGGHRAYRHLLNPMYDGAVYRGGETIEIGAALLFFAATSFPSKFDYDRALIASHQTVPTGSVDFARWLVNIGEQLRPRSRSESNGDAAPAIGQSGLPDDNDAWANHQDRRQEFLDRIDELVVFPRHGVDYVGWTREDRALEAIAIALSLIRKHFPHCTGADAMAVAVIGGMVQEHASRRHAERLVFTAKNPTGEVFELGCIGLEKIPGLFQDEIQELQTESGKIIVRVADSKRGVR